MKLIVGLGNPQQEYENTRHNIGFKTIDMLCHYFNVSLNKKKFQGFFYQGKNFILAKPLTYMNLSGEFIIKIMHFFKIVISDILIIYDDIAHDVGTLALKPQGSSNGHNGLKSIINHLKTEQFARLKIGIGQPRFSKIDFVLGNFTAEELQKIKTLNPKIIGIVENFIAKDIHYAMNKLHQN